MWDKIKIFWLPRACEQAELQRVGENVLLIVTRNAVVAHHHYKVFFKAPFMSCHSKMTSSKRWVTKNTDSWTSVVPG